MAPESGSVCALSPLVHAGAVPRANLLLGPRKRGRGDPCPAPATQRVAAAEPPEGARWRQDSLLAGRTFERQPHRDP